MRSRRRGGETMKPSARPGATFFDRLSSVMQLSGASAAIGVSSSKAIDRVLDDGRPSFSTTRSRSARRALAAWSCRADFESSAERTAPTNALRGAPSAPRPGERRIRPIGGTSVTPSLAAMSLMKGYVSASTPQRPPLGTSAASAAACIACRSR
jgi:hypothetical protein